MKNYLHLCFGAVFALSLSNTAVFAQATIMKQCGAEWQAHKANKAVVAGETWNQFLSECRVRQAANPAVVAPVPAPAIVPAAPKAAIPVPVTPVAPAPVVVAPRPATVTPTYPTSTAVPIAAAPVVNNGKSVPSPGQQAFYTRERACGAEWKQRRAANQIAVGETWPKYLKECNARLKAALQ